MDFSRLNTIKEDIRKEISKIKDLQSLKKEVVHLADQIKNGKIDLGFKMSPKQKQKLRKLEQSYHQMMRNLGQAQKKFDKELSQFMKVLNRARSDAEKRFQELRNLNLSPFPAKAPAPKKRSRKKTAKSSAS